MNFQERLKKSIDTVRGEYKLMFFIGFLLGAYYLNSFLGQFGVPFPAYAIPTMLVVVGGISIFFVVIISAYLIVIGIVNESQVNGEINRLINTDKNGFYNPKIINSIRNGTIIYALPMLFTLAILYTTRNYLVFFVLFIIYTIWGISYGLILWERENALKQRYKFLLKIVGHILLIQALSFPSLVIFLSLIFSINEDLSTGQFIIISISYVFVNMICIIPVFSPKKFKNIHHSEKLLGADELLHKSRANPTYVILSVLVIASIVPGVSSFVGKLALRSLNIGGGIKFIAKDASENCYSWPQFLIQKSSEHSCVSKVGQLILKLDDRAYALFERKEGEFKMVSINLSKSVIVIDLPDDLYKRRNKKKNH